MKSKIIKALIYGIVVLCSGLGMTNVFALEPSSGDFNAIYGSGSDITTENNLACEIDSTNPACDDGGKNAFSVAKNIINTVLGVIGVIAVIVIIIAGVMMTTSAGDPGKVKKARSAIIYAIIGLLIAVLAVVIVNFVLEGVFE